MKEVHRWRQGAKTGKTACSSLFCHSLSIGQEQIQMSDVTNALIQSPPTEDIECSSVATRHTSRHVNTYFHCANAAIHPEAKKLSDLLQ